MPKVPIILGLVLMAVVAAPQQCGQALPPGSPANSVAYKTQAGDTPYALADRFYGDGYMAYKIRDVNKNLLTKEGGFPAGTVIAIPPDQTGRPVDLTRLIKKHY